ncbi:hypothetical protein Hanom_Chr01g00005061 [Helianthus anomalus]
MPGTEVKLQLFSLIGSSPSLYYYYWCPYYIIKEKKTTHFGSHWAHSRSWYEISEWILRYTKRI